MTSAPATHNTSSSRSVSIARPASYIAVIYNSKAATFSFNAMASPVLVFVCNIAPSLGSANGTGSTIALRASEGFCIPSLMTGAYGSSTAISTPVIDSVFWASNINSSAPFGIGTTGIIIFYNIPRAALDKASSILRCVHLAPVALSMTALITVISGSGAAPVRGIIRSNIVRIVCSAFVVINSPRSLVSRSTFVIICTRARNALKSGSSINFCISKTIALGVGLAGDGLASSYIFRPSSGALSKPAAYSVGGLVTVRYIFVSSHMTGNINFMAPNLSSTGAPIISSGASASTALM